MLRWAPWDAVVLNDEGEYETTPGEGSVGLGIRVGSLRFHALLQGQRGRRARRDFVVAVQRGRAAASPTR